MCNTGQYVTESISFDPKITLKIYVRVFTLLMRKLKPRTAKYPEHAHWARNRMNLVFFNCVILLSVTLWVSSGEASGLGEVIVKTKVTLMIMLVWGIILFASSSLLAPRTLVLFPVPWSLSLFLTDSPQPNLDMVTIDCLKLEESLNQISVKWQK